MMGWNPFSKKPEPNSKGKKEVTPEEEADSKKKTMEEVGNEITIQVVEQSDTTYSTDDFGGLTISAGRGNSGGAGAVKPSHEHSRGIVQVSSTAKRLVVPVDVQALVIERDENSNLKPGIHLHWALPDGLLSGVERNLPEESITDDMGMNELFDFPSLPDLWVVVRQWKRPIQAVQDAQLHTNGDGNRTVPKQTSWCSKAWMVDSITRTTMPLDAWVLNREAGSPLTAIQDGDPATIDDQPIWTAGYISSEGRFTFHDLPEIGVNGPFNYMVAGFYSSVSQDPLAMSPDSTRMEWFTRLHEMGWTTILNEVLIELGEEAITVSQDSLFDQKNTQRGGS
jgi:hypothetical protein